MRLPGVQPLAGGNPANILPVQVPCENTYLKRKRTELTLIEAQAVGALCGWDYVHDKYLDVPRLDVNGTTRVSVCRENAIGSQGIRSGVMIFDVHLPGHLRSLSNGFRCGRIMYFAYVREEGRSSARAGRDHDWQCVVNVELLEEIVPVEGSLQVDLTKTSLIFVLPSQLGSIIGYAPTSAEADNVKSQPCRHDFWMRPQVVIWCNVEDTIEYNKN